MSFSSWDVPIKADSHRSADLKEIKFDQSSLVVTLIEEETEDTWQLSFNSLQAFATTTEECSSEILEKLPGHGGFFRSAESAWLNSLGKGDITFLDNAYHFIICCYDEVVEVIADVDSPTFLKLD